MPWRNHPRVFTLLAQPPPLSQDSAATVFRFRPSIYGSSFCCLRLERAANAVLLEPPCRPRPRARWALTRTEPRPLPDGTKARGVPRLFFLVPGGLLGDQRGLPLGQLLVRHRAGLTPPGQPALVREGGPRTLLRFLQRRQTGCEHDHVHHPEQPRVVEPKSPNQNCHEITQSSEEQGPASRSGGAS